MRTDTMISISAEDKRWMRRALRLARKAWGRTHPNPMVGAVVVRGSDCVGEGWHHAAGEPHAEIHALEAAGSAARRATLYVTLEPCSTRGRTPPCTDAIIRAGVGRVVVGAVDRNPLHLGRAEAMLQREGIEVESGVLAAECERLNEAFFWWIEHRRPFVLVKMGMTLDGRIATAGGESQWITGPAARNRVQRLRQWADAIMVGGYTVERDDPRLTVRRPAKWPKQPLPCVWTSRPLPPTANLCRDAARPPLCGKPETRAEWLEFLRELGSREVLSLLIEGGGELAAAALKAGVVNKIAFFVAPMILGGRGSRPVVGGDDPDHLSQAAKLRDLRVSHVGDDLLITGYCTNVHGTD